VRLAKVAVQYGEMSTLSWGEVKNFFDPDLNGVLPDVHVSGTSIEDWRAIVDLVVESNWRWQYFEDSKVVPIPSLDEVFSRPWVELHVWPDPEVLAIFRPHSTEEIDFDVDLRELQGQHGVDILCGFLSTIGRRLGKPVVMTPEGANEHPVLGFDPGADRVVLLAGPGPGPGRSGKDPPAVPVAPSSP
jgi:hypothetical protein